MAISANAVWELRTTATANNVNGGFFVTGATGTDYSQQNACQYSTGAATTLGAGAQIEWAAAAADMVGNGLHIQSGTNFTAGYYEAISVVVGVSVTVDRACCTGIGATGVIKVGGACSLVGTGTGLTEDLLFEAAEPGNTIWVKAGTYTFGTWTSVAKVGTAILPIKVRGYNATRGDNPTGDDRPYWNFGASAAHTVNSFWHHYYIRGKGSVGTVATSVGSGCLWYGCKFETLNATATNGALYITNGNSAINCELINARGVGITAQGGTIINCYIHSCLIGIKSTYSATLVIKNNIISDCSSANIDFSDGALTNGVVDGNTLSGFPTSLFGIGIRGAAGAGFSNTHIVNNIITGFATGIVLGTENNNMFITANNFHNNTADVTLCAKGVGNIALAAQFTSLAEITGTDGTSSTTVLSSATADFTNVVAGRDSVYVVSGSGVTAGFYGITIVAAGALTLDRAIVANAVADIVFKIVTGRDFRVGANMKSAGLPNLNSAIIGTQYTDLGALQKAPAVGSGGGIPSYSM